MRPKLMRHLSSASECSRTHRMAIIGLKLMINASSRSEEHTSELQSHLNLVCRLLLEKKKKKEKQHTHLNLVCHLVLEKNINSGRVTHSRQRCARDSYRHGPRTDRS